MMNQNFKKQKNFFYLLGILLFLGLLTTTTKYIFDVFSKGKLGYEISVKNNATGTQVTEEHKKVTYDFKVSEFGTKKINADSFQDYADIFCQKNEEISKETSFAPFSIDKSKFGDINFFELSCNYAEYFNSNNTFEQGYYLKLDLYKNYDEIQEAINNPFDHKYDSIYFHDGISDEGGKYPGSRYLIKSEKIKSFANYDLYIYLEKEASASSFEPYLRAIKTFKHSNGFTYYMSYTRKLFAGLDVKNLEFSDECQGQRENYKCVEVNAVKVFKEKYLNSKDPDVVDLLTKINEVMTAIGEN